MGEFLWVTCSAIGRTRDYTNGLLNAYTYDMLYAMTKRCICGANPFLDHDSLCSTLQGVSVESRSEAAAEFVQLTHMCDWIWNEKRAALAEDLGLTAPWRSHAAYLEAREIAGLSANKDKGRTSSFADAIAVSR